MYVSISIYICIYIYIYIYIFPVGSVIKNMSGIQEMRIQSLGWEDPLVKEVATHSNILAWEIPWTEEPVVVAVVVESVSHVWLFVTPWTHARLPCTSLSLAQTHVHWVGNAIQTAHRLSPLLLLFSIFPSIRLFSSELALCIRGSKYWSFSFSISPSNEYSGLISFGIDWFDLLSVKGTLKSLLQHHSWKASILWHSAFFMMY